VKVASISVMVSVVLGLALVASTPAEAVTLGSNLAAASNDSVCKFQSLEPETRVCTVAQRDLLAGHGAAGGLLAQFDGVIVSWSVVSGTALPGTGSVKLALRARSRSGDLGKGPEVELPSSPPGTRHTYAEQMSIGAGQPIDLTISTTNRNTQEAGAPIAFREQGVGTINMWAGEPWKSIWNTEEDVELLLNAEIEPDADHDGLGDLTQDCFPGLLGRQELCGHDLVSPTIQPHFAARQAFLRSGTVVIGVASNESGWASAEGWLQIKGPGGRTYRLRGSGRRLAAGGQAGLRLRVRKRVLKAARDAASNGRSLLVTARVGVADAAGNERQATVRIRPR
jgi:hypothetical protein